MVNADTLSGLHLGRRVRTPSGREGRISTITHRTHPRDDLVQVTVGVETTAGGYYVDHFKPGDTFHLLEGS